MFLVVLISLYFISKTSGYIDSCTIIILFENQDDFLKSLPPSLLPGHYTKGQNSWIILNPFVFNVSGLVDSNSSLGTSENEPNKRIHKSVGNTNHNKIEFCVLIILCMGTENKTLFAIENSGFANSESVVFIITESEQINFASVTELSLTFYFIYSPKSGKHKSICEFCEFEPIVLIDAPIALYRIRTNKFKLNGGNLQSIWYPTIADGYRVKEAFEHTYCISNDRKLYYHKVDRCFAGYIVGMLMAANMLNITFYTSGYTEGDEEVKDNLNLFWLPMEFAIIPNNQLTFGSKMRLVAQSLIYVLHCSRLEETRVEGNKLDRYTSVFEYRIWLAFIAIILFVGFVYKSLCRGMDITWLFFGKPLTMKHNRFLIFLCMVPIVLLSSIYSAAFKTEFLFVDLPTSLVDLAKRGFKFQFYKKHIYQHVISSTPTSLINSIYKGFGISHISQLFDTKEFGFDTKFNITKTLDYMTKKKVLGVGNKGTLVYSTSYSLSLILSLVDQAIINDEYLCGTIAVPIDVYPEIRIGYITWGPLSTELDKLFTIIDESGIVSRIQKLIVFMHGLKDTVSWKKLSDSLQVPNALEMKSSLGKACLLQIAICSGIFCWVVWCHFSLFIYDRLFSKKCFLHRLINLFIVIVILPWLHVLKDFSVLVSLYELYFKRFNPFKFKWF